MERGLPPHVVANQLGHTDGGALVQRLYGHPSEQGIARPGAPGLLRMGSRWGAATRQTPWKQPGFAPFVTHRLHCLTPACSCDLRSRRRSSASTDG
jgi:hypothetical protein